MEAGTGAGNSSVSKLQAQRGLGGTRGSQVLLIVAQQLSHMLPW